MHQVKIEQFEGPLALLLDLIEDNKLDITKVSLSAVADQYLERVNKIESTIGIEELADFLLITSKLLMMKSRLLLPNLVLEEDDEIGNLEEQLKIYKIYRDASRDLRTQINAKQFAFARPWTRESWGMKFLPPKNIKVDELKSTMSRLIEFLARTIVVLPKATLKKIVSLQEKIKDLQTLFTRVKEANFKDFFATTINRSEVVVSFLALLELVKRRELLAEQEAEEIIIKRY